MSTIIEGKISTKGKQLYTVICDVCHKQNPAHCKRSSIARADYFVCPSCDRSDLDLYRKDDEIISTDMFAAPGNWTGVTIRKATPEDLASIERARDILARGLQSLSFADRARVGKK